MKADAVRFRIVFPLVAAITAMVLIFTALAASSETAAQTVDEFKLDPPTLTRSPFNPIASGQQPSLKVSWTDEYAINRYRVQHRKPGENWPPDQGEAILVKDRTSMLLQDLDSCVEYEVRVRVWYNILSVEWSDPTKAYANKCPMPAGQPLASVSLERGATFSKDVSTLFYDPEGEGLTFEVSAENPGVLKLTTSGTNNTNVLVEALNPGFSRIIYKACDPFGGCLSRGNTGVSVPGDVTLSVPENSPAGTLVGDPVTGTPYDGETLTYSLTGNAADSGLFVIDSATGQISVSEGASLDFETTSSYTGRVNWTVREHEVGADVTINVTDLGAGKPGAPTVTRTEFSGQSAPALDVTWTAADANGFTINGYQARYRVKAADGQEANTWTDYTYTDSNGDETSTLPPDATTFNLPDLEAGQTYEFQARAVTSEEGEGPWSDTGEGTANTPPTGSGLSFHPITFSWNEVWLITPSVNLLFAADADGDTLTYWASTEQPGFIVPWLTDDPPLLNVSLRNPLPEDSSVTVTVSAHDAYGGAATVSSSFNIASNEIRSVSENSPAGTLVGRPVQGIPYRRETLTYTLTGEAASAFVIDAATGQISVAQGATLDFETKRTYTGQVNWTVQEQAAAANVTIRLTDVEAGQPGAPVVTRTEFSEPTAPALDVTWTPAADNGLTITDYRLRYRKQGVEDWKVETLDPDTTSFNLPNLEAGATYEFRVRARTEEEGGGPLSDPGEGTANTPPTASSVPFSGGTLGVGGSFNWHEGQPLGSGAFFADADADALTYSASAQHPALLGVSLSGTAGTDAVLTANLLNQGESKVSFVASDPYGGQVTRTTTIVITAKTARDVAENSPAGTAVGAPVTGTPYDDGDDQTDDALAYTLRGKAADSGNFVIDSASGQISVAEGATLDYEAEDGSYRETEIYDGEVIAKFYRGEVHYTVDGHAAVIHVNIRVTDVEAGKPEAPTLTRTPSPVPMNPALDVTWTAPAANGATITGYEAQYRKKTATEWTLYKYDDPMDTNEPPAKISLLSADTTTVNLPDLEARATYEVQVRAVTSLEGEGPWSDIGEGRANIPPTGTVQYIDSGTFPVETAQYGYADWLMLQMDSIFTEIDGDWPLRYEAISEHPLVADARLTCHPDPSYSCINEWDKVLYFWLYNPATTTITYEVHDGYGGHASKTVTVTGSRSETRSVAENSPAGATLGAAVTAPRHTTNAGETPTYTLTGDAADAFVIDSSTGQISVAEGASLDFEKKPSYTGTVEYTVQGQAAAVSLTINVTDIEAGKPGAPTVTRRPSDLEMAPALDITWAAPASADVVVGYEVQYRKKAAQGEDPAGWMLYTYEDGTDGGATELPATPTSMTLPDLDPGATYEAQVRAIGENEGPGDWSQSGEGTANTPPTASGADLAAKTLAVGAADSNDLSGKFTDADGDALTYSASSAHAGVVTAGIAGNTLTVTVINPASATVTYGAHDGYGGHASPRTVAVTGQRSVSLSVAENSLAGTPVGDPVTGTPYNGETLTYALNGIAADSGHFVIDAHTGQISVAQGATLDREARSVYPDNTVEYTVQGQMAVIGLTIEVTDLSAPPAPDAPTVAQSEAEGADPKTMLDVDWKAPEDTGGLSITDYDVQYRKADEANWTGHAFAFDGDTSTTLTGLSEDTAYKVQVRARNAEGVSPWSSPGSGATAFKRHAPASVEPTPGPTPNPTPGVTPAPTQAPPTPQPTQAPPTPQPTQAAPTPYPTQAAPTPYPTQAAPTPYPTQAAPTPYPTQAPPTPVVSLPAPTPVAVALVPAAPTPGPAAPLPGPTPEPVPALSPTPGLSLESNSSPSSGSSPVSRLGLTSANNLSLDLNRAPARASASDLPAATETDVPGLLSLVAPLRPWILVAMARLSLDFHQAPAQAPAVPVAAPEPTPEPPAAMPAETTDDTSRVVPLWPWLLVALAGLLALAFLAGRRRRKRREALYGSGTLQ